MRLLFSPPASEATSLLTLPGAEPPPDSSEPYALKSPGETLAPRKYQPPGSPAEVSITWITRRS